MSHQASDDKSCRSVTVESYLSNTALVTTATGTIPSTCKNANNADMFQFKDLVYDDFCLESTSAWVTKNVIHTFHDLDGEVTYSFRKDHKKKIRCLILQYMPGCFIPVSTTRPSHADSQNWRVFFSCIAHRDGCKKIITAVGNVTHLKKHQETKILFLWDGPPCIHPSFEKYGYIESDQAKLELATKTARNNQIENIQSLQSETYWYTSNHVCSFINNHDITL